MNEARAIGKLGPSRRLHRATDFERQFVKFLFAVVPLDLPFAHQPQKISIRGNVVESVIVHTDVRDMRGHPFNGAAPANFQETLVAHRVELQQRRAVLKTLRPLRPAARSVFPFHGKHGRALPGLPRFFEAEDFYPRPLEQPVDFRQQRFRRQSVVDFDGHVFR